jgi:hypothetical protein
MMLSGPGDGLGKVVVLLASSPEQPIVLSHRLVGNGSHKRLPQTGRPNSNFPKSKKQLCDG